MYRIMIIEDEATIAQEIAKRLRAFGYDVCCVGDFENVMSLFDAFDPQLALIDISLPFFNGYHWCAEIRTRSTVPVMFLSAASENMNIVMAMHMGADDFIAKPFDFDVLLAKIKALLRRAFDFSEPIQCIEFSGASLGLADGVLTIADDRVELTKNELRILQSLLERKGRIVSRSELILKLWQTDQFIDDNTLTVNMTRIRKKLEGIGLYNIIKTKKGWGYYVE